MTAGASEFEELLAAWQERIERGESIDADAEAAAAPHLEGRIREALAAMEGLGRAAVSAQEPPQRAGTLLGPYRLDRLLGSGGMGEVWLAKVEGRVQGLEPGTRVAVKVIHPGLAARPGFFKRFLREAEIGRRLRHVNVVRTLDADEAVADGVATRFLVLEYVEGETLRDLLDEMGRLPEELCRHVGREVAKGLAAIHAAGIVHRDLKPENVLITKDHFVKVTDLGVARLADEGMRVSQSGVFVGSLRYGAPEQFEKAAGLDGRADLHALGVVLYELASGTHPFAGDDFPSVMRRILDETPRRLGELQPQIAPFFEEVVRTLLAKDREQRFGSADELSAVLAEGEESAWWRGRAKAIRTETQRPLRRIRIPRETALYGRETEIAKLRALFDAAKGGDGRVVLVDGEAGIGKSRLVDEFVGLLHSDGEDVNYLFGSYPPGGAATASGAFSTAYREHFGDDESAVREALPVTPLLVPAFAALLRGDAAPEGSEPLTKDSLQTVFVHATRSLASRRTTVVLIDDLHFAPEDGRALLMSLALAVPGHRILLVGCTRPGLDEKWVGQLARLAQTSQLTVPRLGPKELVHLLRDALRSERLAEELSALIAVKSDGNPFFVFEMLRGLKEGQFLAQREDGTWHTTQVIRDIQVPSSVKDLVNARVADLDETERDLLDVAACVGFEFDPSLVAAALGVPVLPALKRFGQIERRHRLVRSAGRHMVFDHHQVQEALYGGLMEQVREHYHAAIAGAIEAQSGAASKEPKDVEGAVCVELAEHFLKGAQGPKALRYLDRALTHLEVNYVNEPAIALADRALTAPALIAGRARVELLLRKGARLELLSRYDAERRDLDDALALVDEQGDVGLRSKVRLRLGINLQHISAYAEAEAAMRAALELGRAAGDRHAEAAAAGDLGSVLTSVGRYAEARDHFERSLELARAIGDRRIEDNATLNLGLVFYALGRLAEARDQDERCLAHAREIGDLRFEAMATVNLSTVLNAVGRNIEARRHSERILTIAREIGDRRMEAVVMGSLGNALQGLGRVAEAGQHHERSLALAREIGYVRGEAIATGHLGLDLRHLGRYAEARQHFERSVALAREIGYPRGEAIGSVNLGNVFLDLGRHVEAGVHLARALDLSRDIHASHVAAACRMTLAELASDQGREGDAEAGFSDAISQLDAVGDAALAADSRVALGALLAKSGHDDEARALLDAALAAAVEIEVPATETVALARLATLRGGDVAAAEAALARNEERLDVRSLMESRLALFRATGERAHLAAAKRVFDDILAHAPEDCREPMLANVRLHREIADACREAGL